MGLEVCYNSSPVILMEGALGERLKREYGIAFDADVAMAGLVYEEKSRAALRELWGEYISIARRHHFPFMATTPTRRANRERVSRSLFDERIIEQNVRFLQSVRDSSAIDMYVGGLMGCKGDAYKASEALTVSAAEEFHSWQADLFRDAGADFLYAGIMPAITEAIGMARAMEQTGLPYIISFMVHKDGRLIDGTTINDAIVEIDNHTNCKPLCYMANCIHPSVLYQALTRPFNQTVTVRERFHGIQGNTSPLPPEELDGCVDLKASDAGSWADSIIKLREITMLKVIGGCCGTDDTHMEELAKRLR